MAGQDLVDILKQAQIPHGLAEGQIARYGVKVGSRDKAGKVGERLNLGSKKERAGDLREIDRLDADPVAGQQELAALLIPDCEGEHAVEVVDTIGTLLFVQMHNGVGIAACAVDVPPGLEAFSQVGVVIYLAVEDDPYCAAFVAR